MPYILSPLIHTELPGLWGEGSPYRSNTIYDIQSKDPTKPPVHYAEHSFRPHSIPHIDAPRHIIPGADTVERFFEEDRNSAFYGPVVVVRLTGSRWKADTRVKDTMVWRVPREELEVAVQRVTRSNKLPNKIFITAEDTPITADGFHDSSHVLVLSEEAARWLVSNPQFNAYGTSWKSSDFEPGSKERPIHKILLSQAVLFEQLKLDHVPESTYFLTAFPIKINGASESPVTPVLFEWNELSQALSLK